MSQESEKSPTWLLDHSAGIWSETGEDGIIKKILQVLPSNDKWCAEFGAADGQQASNTRNLITNEDYHAVLIESDKEKFANLQKSYAGNSTVITINKLVGFGREASLDRILETTPIPRDFDFLSIDIDGNDYHAWKAILEYHPKVICVEFNPTIPTEVRFVQPADNSVNQGAGLLPLVELGKEKGYELVSVLPFNAFFVKTEYFPLFGISDNSPLVLRTNLEQITYLFSGYDGRIFLRGRLRLPWHNIDFRESKVQHLPEFLRKYPPNYGRAERIMFFLFGDPRRLISAACKRTLRFMRRS